MKDFVSAFLPLKMPPKPEFNPRTDVDSAPVRAKEPDEYLPAAGRQKLQRLRDEHEMRRGQAHAIGDKIEEQRTRQKGINSELAVRSQNSPVSPESELGKDYNRRLNEITVEIARLQGLRQAQHEAHAGDMATLSRCEHYLKQNRLRITAAPAIEAKLSKGETHAAAVARVRNELARLREDAQAIEDAPRPSSVVKAEARALIERLAAEGRPDIESAIESSNPVTIRRSSRGDFESAVALVAWTMKDALIAKLEAEISDASDDASALTDTERKKRRAEIAERILQAERIEEAHLDAAAAQGHRIDRRRDVDPRAVLGVDGPAPDGLI